MGMHVCKSHVCFERQFFIVSVLLVLLSPLPLSACSVCTLALLSARFALYYISLCVLCALSPPTANSAAFAALDESKVDVKDLFMHRLVLHLPRNAKVTCSRVLTVAVCSTTAF